MQLNRNHKAQIYFELLILLPLLITVFLGLNSWMKIGRARLVEIEKMRLFYDGQP